ncbi:SAM-dependent methyltransferase [Luteitalea sp.]
MTDATFDTFAAGYDGEFTETIIGRRMRDVVWQRCDARFASGMHVLEINCGTGEDAIHLARRGVRVLATDSSPAMLDRTRAKVAAAGLESFVDVAALRIEDIGAHVGRFDGVLSNFGGLNCVSDLQRAACGLAAAVAAGGVAVLTVMGPLVPWEWAWFLGRGDWRRATRRLRPGGVAWRDLVIRYPSAATLSRAFVPHFQPLRVAALGAVLPPPFAESWAARHPRATDWLARTERRFDTTWPLTAFGDHYIVELQRGAR